MVIEIEDVNKGKSIEEIAWEISRSIHRNLEERIPYTQSLLMEFAEEIKRQAVEP